PAASATSSSGARRPLRTDGERLHASGAATCDTHPVLHRATAPTPRLGASCEERRQSLPGDDLVAARWQTTGGIDTVRHGHQFLSLPRRVTSTPRLDSLRDVPTVAAHLAVILRAPWMISAGVRPRVSRPV